MEVQKTEVWTDDLRVFFCRDVVHYRASRGCYSRLEGFTRNFVAIAVEGLCLAPYYIRAGFQQQRPQQQQQQHIIDVVVHYMSVERRVVYVSLGGDE